MPKITRQAEPAQLPDWGTFKVQMFSDAAYRRVSAACPEPLIISRLETFFAIQGDEYGLAMQLWGGMIQLCPADKRPTAAEATQWEQIASTNDMPIKFTETGQLQLRT